MAEELFSHIADSLHSIVGEGTRFRGDFTVRGLLRIDGDFIGSITTDGKVLVSKNGRVDCAITADVVVVGGTLKGSIVARKNVEILSSGIVLGTIESPRLIIHEDVIFHGSCRVTPDVHLRAERVLRIEEREKTGNGASRGDGTGEKEALKENVVHF